MPERSGGTLDRLTLSRTGSCESYRDGQDHFWEDVVTMQIVCRRLEMKNWKRYREVISITAPAGCGFRSFIRALVFIFLVIFLFFELSLGKESVHSVMDVGESFLVRYNPKFMYIYPFNIIARLLRYVNKHKMCIFHTLSIQISTLCGKSVDAAISQQEFLSSLVATKHFAFSW